MQDINSDDNDENNNINEDESLNQSKIQDINIENNNDQVVQDQINPEQVNITDKIENQLQELQALLEEKENQNQLMIQKIELLEQQLQEKNEQIEQLNKENLKLKILYEDDNKQRIVKEQLRQPKPEKSNQPYLKDGQQEQGIHDKYQWDQIIKSNPDDFWNQGTNQMMPAKPKRLHDVVNPNDLWINRFKTEDIEVGQIKQIKGGKW